MMNKLLSAFKTRQPDTHTAAENEAAKSISSPEKAAELLARLQAAVEIAEEGPNLARRNMLRSQREQAAFACRRYDLENERQLVSATLQHDKTSGEKDLIAAQKNFANADQVLTKHQERQLAVQARLAPLEAKLALAVQSAADRVISAQAAFDAAVLKGDEQAEIAAAEKLYQLQTEGKNTGGPLQLRLEAIRREEVDAKTALAAALHAKQDASKAILRVKAEIALVEYDRQAQALLDAYVMQATAVQACTGMAISAVRAFDMQVSSAKRIVSGIAVSNGRFPDYVMDGLVRAMSAEPDLAILAIRADDIADPLPMSPSRDGVTNE